MLMTIVLILIIRYITVTASFLHLVDFTPYCIRVANTTTETQVTIAKSIKMSSTEMSVHINDKFKSRIPTDHSFCAKVQ